jgi:autotransporter passenger strand-loop-strand repeat protein
MTGYTAPPNKTGLVLGHNDFLTVRSGGTATDTTINGGLVDVFPQGSTDNTIVNHGGRLNVFGTSTNTTIHHGGVENDSGTSVNTTIDGGGIENVRGVSTGTTINHGGVEDVDNRGTDFSTTINNGGIQNVRSGGVADGALINTGGVENVREFGTTTGAIINGGIQNVFDGGIANNTTINAHGIEIVHRGGFADNVTFGSPDATLELANPADLRTRSTISNIQVGDVIDFLNTTATTVHQNDQHTNVTVKYEIGNTTRTITYLVADQQPNTEFKLQSDGHGGTDLVLVPITGVQPLHHFEA